MPVQYRRFVASLCASAVLLAGCGGAKRVCEDAHELYQSARNNPPLRIPPGLTEPDRSGALQIPEAQPVPARDPTRCLDEPPSYFQSQAR